VEYIIKQVRFSYHSPAPLLFDLENLKQGSGHKAGDLSSEEGRQTISVLIQYNKYSVTK
jgi:hypothetical protein